MLYTANGSSAERFFSGVPQPPPPWRLQLSLFAFCERLCIRIAAPDQRSAHLLFSEVGKGGSQHLHKAMVQITP
jgi:hypothetical protein